MLKEKIAGQKGQDSQLPNSHCVLRNQRNQGNGRNLATFDISRFDSPMWQCYCGRLFCPASCQHCPWEKTDIESLVTTKAAEVHFPVQLDHRWLAFVLSTCTKRFWQPAVISWPIKTIASWSVVRGHTFRRKAVIQWEVVTFNLCWPKVNTQFSVCSPLNLSKSV